MSKRVGEWLGFAVGVALLAALLGGYYASRFHKEPNVIIGAHDQVFYFRRATREEAKSLGEALRETGFLHDQGNIVLLWKGGGPTVISFMVGPGTWDRRGAIADYTEIGRRVATAVGGFPIEVNLVDSTRAIRKRMMVGKTTIGSKDILYYFGDATRSDARALGDALREAGYFADLGFTVTLLTGDGTEISFVVQEGGWDDPAVLATLERLVRRVAASVGGLPVSLRLLNREMELKKQIVVR